VIDAMPLCIARHPSLGEEGKTRDSIRPQELSSISRCGVRDILPGDKSAAAQARTTNPSPFSGLMSRLSGNERKSDAAVVVPTVD
jgi:hypothetical protein